MSDSETTNPARSWNTRLGLILFFVYLALYSGFVLISAFAPRFMERIVVVGLNLAVIYGFLLIVAALLMSVVYGLMCRNEPVEPIAAQPRGKQSDSGGAIR